MPLHVTLPRGPLTVRPGGATHARVVVLNTGRRSEDVTATVLGGAASWTTLLPPRLLLPPGGEGVLEAELHPPRIAHVRAGPMPFGVQVTAANGPDAAVAEELLVVESFTDLALELAPAIVLGRSGTTWLHLVNRGNTSRHVLVAARGSDDRIRLDCRPDGLTVAPGAGRAVRVRLRGAPPPWTGPSRRFSFEVVVRPVDDDPGVVHGVLLVRPRLAGLGARPSPVAGPIG